MFDRHLKVWPEGVPSHIEVPEHSVALNLAQTAERVPANTAIIFHGAALTYGELNAQVESLAGWLQANGVGKGDRVLLYMQNSPHFVIGYYAIMRADAVVVPVNPMNRMLELRHLAEDTGARVALVGQELLPHIAPILGETPLAHVIACAYADMTDPACDLKLPEALAAPSPADYGLPGVTRWADALAAGNAPGPVTAGPDDLAVIPYSSGTTGRPKGCMHTHRTAMWTIVGGLVWNPRGLGKPSLVTLPLFHVTGMQNSMNGPIMAGDCMVIMARWKAAQAAQLIARHRVARWRSIAAMAIDLVNDPELEAYDLSSLEAVGGGGASVPAAVARRLKARTGLDYVEGYGMSETIAGTHINPPDRPRPQCLGIPVFAVDSRVVDPVTMAELGPEEPGEILIHAPQNFVGYWNDPEATRDAFIEIDGKPFLRTGDIGRYDASGYFYMVDRVKRMINAAGFKVWPTEVEGLMHEHPQVAEVCVVGRPDPRRGETVLAYVVPKGDTTPEALIAWCREQMSAYKCPREIVFREALPRSPTGKLLWRALQDEAAAVPAS